MAKKKVESNKDDALFEALDKGKKRKRRKILITVISIVVVVALILTVTVLGLRKRVRDNFGGKGREVLSYEAAIGTINTTVSGSGTLAEVDLEELTVPEGVEVKEIQVERDDVVAQGDLLATVDMASVLSAMSAVQEELEALDDEIGDASGEKVNSTVKAGVSGIWNFTSKELICPAPVIVENVHIGDSLMTLCYELRCLNLQEDEK